MAVPQSKDELLAAIEGSFDRLLTELRAVAPELARERSMEGHARDTRMSVADLAAYLVGWNELVLKWLDRDAAGEPIDFPDTGFKWNELGRLAQKFYLDYEAVPYAQLLDRLETARNRIVAEVEVRSDEELYGHPWYQKWTLGRMIQFNTSSPYANARGRLRRWLKARGHDPRPDRSGAPAGGRKSQMPLQRADAGRRRSGEPAPPERGCEAQRSRVAASAKRRMRRTSSLTSPSSQSEKISRAIASRAVSTLSVIALPRGVATASRTRRSAALSRRSARPSSSSFDTCRLTVV